MKQYPFTKKLPLTILGAAILGAALRAWLYAAGTDEKGLLISGHPAHILIWLLTAAVTLTLFVGCLPLRQGNKFRFNFPASLPGAAGCAVAALGVLLDAMGHLNGDTLQTITGVLGILSSAALLFIGFCRLKGRYPSVLFNGLVCLYLMLTLVGMYRTWSAAPQLQDYVFPLLGCVFVMLACYQDAAFAAKSGSRRKHTFFHLMAVYLCIVGLPQNENFLFYLSLSAWMLTGLCNQTPMAPTPSAAPAAEAEAQPEAERMPPLELEAEITPAFQPEDETIPTFLPETQPEE